MREKAGEEMDDQERKARKAARERERYKKAKERGFTRQQARSIKKTIETDPSLIRDIEDISASLADSISNLPELIKDVFTPGKAKSAKKPTYKKPKPKLTDRQRQLNKEAGAFKRFLGRNPGLSQRQAIEQWREKGHSIGRERAAEIYRGKTGKPKQESKVTRFKTYGVDKNPGGQFYMKSRYNYMMEYTVYVSGMERDEVRYMTLASPTRLNAKDRIQMVMDAYDKGELDQNEYYAAIYLDEDSIKTLYMIDTAKKSNRFAAYEASMKQEHPDWSISQMYREYKAMLDAKKKPKG